jgi:hypothetical protein
MVTPVIIIGHITFLTNMMQLNFERIIYIYIYIIVFLLLTASGLMLGDSVYKDKVHEHPQYKTAHIHKYNTSTRTLQNRRKRKYRKNTETT